MQDLVAARALRWIAVAAGLILLIDAALAYRFGDQRGTGGVAAARRLTLDELRGLIRPPPEDCRSQASGRITDDVSWIGKRDGPPALQGGQDHFERERPDEKWNNEVDGRRQTVVRTQPEHPLPPEDHRDPERDADDIVQVGPLPRRAVILRLLADELTLGVRNVGENSTVEEEPFSMPVVQPG